MAELGEIAEKVRSKNAGPFWLTIDIFCGSPDRYAHIASHLNNAEVAASLATPLSDLKRFDIANLNVIKFSVPRPTHQGTRDDRDMHGAQWANIIAELSIPDINSDHA